MNAIRRPAVAGQFYPNDPGELRSAVEGYMAKAASKAAANAGPAPKALIAPHAGYIYSGTVAASAYALIAPLKGTIRRVVLLGPCHRVPVNGCALSGADAFMTPLGPIDIDKDAAKVLSGLPQVKVFDDTHAFEHSLEVHLPFLQVVLGNFKLLPLVVGQASPGEIADVLEKLWGGPETLIVVSSDLSHYLPYDAAREIDGRTCRAIETLDPAAIGRDQACGRIPVGGLLELAKRRHMRVETVDVRNSGDTAGPKDRVVGYGSWAFYEPAEGTAKKPEPKKLDVRMGPAKVQARLLHPSPRKTVAAPVAWAKPAKADPFEARTKALLDKHGPTLLRLAAASIEHGLKAGKAPSVGPEDHPTELRAQGACFVTLKRQARLRGCIGSPQAHRPLIVDVVENGFRAAFKDPRFKPLTEAELDGLDLSISVLSPSRPMTVADEADLLGQLRPRIDGLVIADGQRRALFLPSVWEQIPDPKTFLGHLKAKAGMKPDHWSPAFQAFRFIAEEIHAKDLGAPLWTLKA